MYLVAAVVAVIVVPLTLATVSPTEPRFWFLCAAYAILAILSAIDIAMDWRSRQ